MIGLVYTHLSREGGPDVEEQVSQKYMMEEYDKVSCDFDIINDVNCCSTMTTMANVKMKF